MLSDENDNDVDMVIICLDNYIMYHLQQETVWKILMKF